MKRGKKKKRAGASEDRSEARRLEGVAIRKGGYVGGPKEAEGQFKL
jgi:hypothetical protein